MLRNRKTLPKNAKRVFRGVIFEVWQWKQKMFDGSYAVFERLTRPNTVNIIGVVGNKILLIKQKQPDWKRKIFSLAGGRIDEGETPLQAAKRELLEETGHISTDWTLWKEQNPSGKIEWTVYTYIARNCSYKKPLHPDEGEKIQIQIADFNEFLELANDPEFYEGELKCTLLRARYDKKFQKEFYRMLFG